MSNEFSLLSDIGEKAFIRDFIRPLFNPDCDPAGVGDDCAMIAFGEEFALASTDRVPADLTAFRCGILNYFGLGDYLARLNLSDIAACGGTPTGLLLNLGLPDGTRLDQAQDICRGFQSCATKYGVRVLGGDMTNASELSISATSLGRVDRQKVLTRRGARPGDSIFLSRPIGLANAALRVYLGNLQHLFSEDDLRNLRRQFTDMAPMFALGGALVASGNCSSCMDNTDGTGQSLYELSEASGCAFTVERTSVRISPIIERVCNAARLRPCDAIFDAGSDLSLLGSLRGKWTSESASKLLGHPIEIIGRVEEGRGVGLESPGEARTPLIFKGWNYFH